MTAKSVTGSYFPLLGQAPLLGRLFDASRTMRRNEPLVVLTAAYWAQPFRQRSTRRSAAASRVDGGSYTIVGVLQEHVGPLERDVALFTAGALASAERKGPFFMIGHRPPAPGRVAGGGARCALRATNRAALSDLEVVVSGRKGNVGPAWI